MAAPVVLLHGFATSTERTWREPGWFDLLKDARRRAIGIDLLGHGDARKPTDPAAYDDLAGAALEAFPESPADVIAYSLGARTALQIALEHPGRIERLVLGGIGRNVVHDADVDAEGDGTLPPHIASRFDALIATAGNDADALRACMSRPRRPFTVHELATIDIPCLVVIGEDDFAGPADPLVDALPHVDLTVLPGVDHFGLPKQFGFIDAALEFIDAVPTWD